MPSPKTPLIPNIHPLPDVSVLGYDVVGRIAIGGFGAVYEVRNRCSLRREAMKTLRADVAANPEYRTRFLREIQMLAVCDHPNLVKLTYATELGRDLVLFMEYVSGHLLSDLIAKGRVDRQLTCEYTHQLASALSHLHQMGLIHRDITARNVIIDERGLPKLLDLGIGQREDQIAITPNDVILGSPRYTSPEQIEGKGTSPASDVYSLGVLVFEMATGAAPFTGPDIRVHRAHLTDQPSREALDRSNLPSELKRTVIQMLAKDPDRRPGIRLVEDRFKAFSTELSITKRTLKCRRVMTLSRSEYASLENDGCGLRSRDSYNRFRKAGDELFAAGDWESALFEYKKCVEYVEFVFRQDKFWIGGDFEMLAYLWERGAICLIRLQHYRPVISRAGSVG